MLGSCFAGQRQVCRATEQDRRSEVRGPRSEVEVEVDVVCLLCRRNALTVAFLERSTEYIISDYIDPDHHLLNLPSYCASKASS